MATGYMTTASAATIRTALVAVLRRGVLGLALAGVFCLPLAAQDNPLVQRGVPAEATAANAVAAREVAHASAARIAFQRMAEALGESRSAPPASQLDQMVAAIIIEEERTTATRYIGRVTVQFSPGAVSAALGRSVGGGSAGGAAPSPGLPLNVPTAATSTVEAEAFLGSLPEWLELRRRLLQSGSVVSVEVLAMNMDTARVRLGLRALPAEAAAALAGMGLFVESSGPVWQVGLGGAR
jgi:hypothetical protein